MARSNIDSWMTVIITIFMSCTAPTGARNSKRFFRSPEGICFYAVFLYNCDGGAFSDTPSGKRAADSGVLIRGRVSVPQTKSPGLHNSTTRPELHRQIHLVGCGWNPLLRTLLYYPILDGCHREPLALISSYFVKCSHTLAASKVAQGQMAQSNDSNSDIITVI